MQKVNDLKQINEKLDLVIGVLGEVKADMETVREDLDTVREDLDTVKLDLEEVKDTQENRVLPSVIETETTLKSYADSYKTNQDHIERLDTRLSEVENNLNITPSEDLKIPHFISG